MEGCVSWDRKAQAAQAAVAMERGLAEAKPATLKRFGEDPLGDVLDWLGRYDLRSHGSKGCEARGPREPTLDVGDECPQRSPTHVQPPRLMLPKMDKPSSLAEKKRHLVHATSSCLSPVCLPDERVGRDHFDEEEEEWDMRQRRSGTVGRLVIYHRGELPRDDVVLRGGGKHHVVVAGVREGGQAAKVGVRAGDRLVSIDGKKDFVGQAADAVRDQLAAPVVLVFLGFVGKLQAEVRLSCSAHICGFSARQEVIRGSCDAPVRFCDERIFDAGVASLFLAIAARQQEAGVADESRPKLEMEMLERQTPMFELQRVEACGLVKRALQRMEERERLVQPQCTLSSPRPIWPLDADGQDSLP